QVLIEVPALDLLERLVELGLWQRLVDEALAARELAEVPHAQADEVWRNRLLPERQVLRQIGLQGLLGAIEAAEIRAHVLERRRLRHPPERVKLIGNDLAQAELARHVDLRRQQAGGLDFTVEQCFEARAEAAGVHGLDLFQRQILFQPERNVEMAA